jgi:hypothetical protein
MPSASAGAKFAFCTTADAPRSCRCSTTPDAELDDLESPAVLDHPGQGAAKDVGINEMTFEIDDFLNHGTWQ